MMPIPVEPGVYGRAKATPSCEATTTDGYPCRRYGRHRLHSRLICLVHLRVAARVAWRTAEKKRSEIIWHWGQGGHYPLTRNNSVPSNERNWTAFVNHAPAVLIDRAVKALEAIRDEEKS